MLLACIAQQTLQVMDFMIFAKLPRLRLSIKLVGSFKVETQSIVETVMNVVPLVRMMIRISLLIHSIQSSEYDGSSYFCHSYPR
jgi:hypothetical protein